MEFWKNVAFYDDEGKIAKIEYLKTINILDIRSIINVVGDTRRLQNYHFLLYLTGTHTRKVLFKF